MKESLSIFEKEGFSDEGSVMRQYIKNAEGCQTYGRSAVELDPQRWRLVAGLHEQGVAGHDGHDDGR